MRVLVVGEFAWDHYQASFCRGLRAVGAEVHELREGGAWRHLDAVRRAQIKYVVGPRVPYLNARLLAACARHRPTVVLAWLTSWLWPSTIAAVQRLGARVVLYNNDDPFGPDRGTRASVHFRALVPHVDACFAYRARNLDDLRQAGARRVFLMRSWYSAAVHRPVALTPADHERFDADATFAGHYEDDGRLEALERLVDAGVRVRVFGGGWDAAGARGRALFGRVVPVLGDDYVRALQAAKTAIVFLSARNRDLYTRRCFEIPAVGTLMVAPRTSELTALFEEGTEAAYFGSTGELVDVVRRYVGDDALRERVSAAGHARCLRDGHDATARAAQFLRDVETLFSSTAAP